MLPAIRYNGREGAFARVAALARTAGLRLAPAYGPSLLELKTADGQVRFQTPERTPAGEWRVRLQALPGVFYRIQASTNLTDWLELWRTEAGSDLIELLDTDSAGLPYRFYRALEE
jgi:hypothetical protein